MSIEKPDPPDCRYIKEGEDIPLNSKAYRICMRNCPIRKRGNIDDLKGDIIKITEEDRKESEKNVRRR